MAASLSGQVFDDLNGNQQWEPAAPTLEPALGCWTVFLDANQNGSLDNGEKQQSTASDGSYHFTVDGPGQYTVNLVPEPGYDRTKPIRFGLNTTLVAGAVQDHVFDPVRSILYSTVGSQVLRTNPKNSQELLVALGVGTSLTAVDITPNGQFLLVGEAATAGGTGRLYKINLASNSVTPIDYSLQANEGGVFDIAAVSNDRVLFTTTSTTNGLVPLREIDLSTNAVTARTESFGAAAGEVRSHSRFEHNGSRADLLLVQAHNPAGRVDWYSSASNSFVKSTLLNQTLDNAHIAISRDGKFAAIEAPGLGLKVYSDRLELITTLNHFRGGVAFDPHRNILYAGDTATDELVAIDSSAWNELYRVAVGEDLPATGTYFEMQTSPRSKFLSVTTPSGVRFVQIDRPVPYVVNVADGQSLAHLDFGNWANGENRRPKAFDNSYSLAEDGSISRSMPGILQNDFDPENDSLSAQLVDDVQHGVLSLLANGAFTYTPFGDYFGPDRFTYLASDNQYVSCRAATVNFNVTPVNDPPTQIDISGMSVDENVTSGDIGQVVVVDADPGDQFIFLLSDARFEIVNGMLRLRDGISLDHEDSPTIELTITAIDQGTPPASVSTTITIQVTDVNEFDPTIETTEIEVTEGSTTVGTVETRDDDSTQTLQITIVGGNDDGIFSIDPSTGIITVNDGHQLDYEGTQTFVLTVSVSDDVAPSRTTTTDVTITVTDGNEHDPAVIPATFEIAEDSPKGMVVGRVVATDDDAGQTLTYAIVSGNEAGAFTIDSSTGEIVVLNGGALDREQTEQYVLTIQATDSFSPSRSGSAEITIMVTDVNESDPTAADQTVELLENSPDGTIVTTVSATDGDATSNLTFAITGGDADGAFAIDDQTGEITVANGAALDFESILQFVLTVTVTDSISSSRSGTAQITIDLLEVNEFDPEMSDQFYSAPEDAQAGFAVGTVSASDQDRTHAFAYSILAGDDGGRFAIDPIDGIITVTQDSVLHGSVGSEYVLTVRVSDGGDPDRSIDALVTITVVPGNSHAPSAPDAHFSLPENSAQGTIVGSVTATDPDDGTTFSFQLADGTNGPFAIDSATGEITVIDAAGLDYEESTQFVLTVFVSDGGTPAKSDVASVTIDLTDVNEFQPTVIGATLLSVDENSVPGTVVGAVTASDDDLHQVLTYSISGAAFAIGPSSGVITVANRAAIDYEASDHITVTVTATDNGSPSKSGSATFTIELNNLNEFAPVVPDLSFTINEHPPVGFVVGTVTASDADSTQPLFEIVGGNAAGTFQINSATGQITVLYPEFVDFEAAPQILLLVLASDHGSPPMSTTGTVTINVQGINEPPLGVYLDLTSVIEHSPGATVGLVTVFDPDIGDTHTFSVDDSRFTVDGNRILKLKAGQEVDYDTSHQIPIEITATDSAGLATSQHFVIEVLVNFKPWQNSNDPLDVNGDGMVTPGDVLLLVNEINDPHTSDSRGRLPGERPDTPNTPFYDVNGDGWISPIDVLIIINDLNREDSSQQAEGEAGIWQAPTPPAKSQPASTGEEIDSFPWLPPSTSTSLVRSGSRDVFDDLESTLDDLAIDIAQAWLVA